MRAVRPVEVVEPLPFAQFCFEIDVSFVAEQLIKFLAVRSVRSLDFSIQLRRAAFDIGVAYAEILDVPVELCLELVAIIGPDFFDPKGKLFDDVVDKIDRVGLGMLLIDFQSPNTRGIVNGGILKASDLFTLFPK